MKLSPVMLIEHVSLTVCTPPCVSTGTDLRTALMCLCENLWLLKTDPESDPVRLLLIMCSCRQHVLNGRSEAVCGIIQIHTDVMFLNNERPLKKRFSGIVTSGVYLDLMNRMKKTKRELK